MRRGFTLLELLIVMAILGVMMAIVVPSMGALPSTQVSMAAKDSLRLMRYARNMAIQTQQPVVLTFANGSIAISSSYDKDVKPAAEGEATTSTKPIGTSAKEGQFAVNAGRIDTIGLEKKYDAVAFEFLGYNDTVSVYRASETPADIQRRTITSSTSLDGVMTRSTEEESFSITVRANGTTRPFSIRVYERENDQSTGDTITFDFLCSGTIHDDE